MPPRSTRDARQAAERAARVLAEDARVQLVYLFGSTVDRDRTLVRDVDLAVSCEPRLSTAALMRLRADAVATAGGDIDLVSLDDASVVLAREIADTGQCLFARTPDLETAFVTRARARYWDFKPFLDVQWELAGKRLAERRRGPEA